ncbi:TPA: MobH family relaxase [Haemophilus influenzae]|uniref:MobH family relaxase n=1 Tax=Haemophilus TaxID=724 RepID=UPI0008A5745D|nr:MULTISPECIES: MobH family relaxase [Haemophilus]WFL70239.1 MobH family relaxase [Haemophilus influenzae]MBE4912420.1 TraI domain-containing protein [Haemophilus parainfluenzae]OFS54438.1 relaxase [Haemophilus sp. HMSC066D03]OFS56784.1 relaxase [Haemophilus sp. HMSC066D02]WFL72136.1 MobH family relaxase [Haemophilus influenzae]
MLSSIFHKIRGKKQDSLNITSSLKNLNLSTFKVDDEGWITPFTASELLNSELRQKYLNLLWQQVSMTQDMFNELYKKPIERYAEMVQLLPASESHHHSHLGGMLDHGLEVLSFSAKLRQSYVLPQNAAPEEQSKQRDAWTAAVIYAALVHDIGKVIVDIEIQLKDGSRWFPWLGVPTQPYKFKYIKGRDYDLHPVMGSFLANYLIPKEAFAWLAEYPEAFSSLMYAMADHKDKSGLLSEIVQKADQNSVTLALGGDVSKLTQKPITSFAKQLVMALRHLLQHKFKINTPKGPSDGWLTEDALWLMSKPTADQIRAYLLEQGITAPSDNPKLFSEMQSLGIIESTNDGTAIWHCRIKADSGWCPPKAFSLLRIKPEVAWENLNDRPGTFLGRVNIENEEQLSSSEDIKEENSIITESEVQLPVITDTVNKPALSENIPSQNTQNFETKTDMTDLVMNLFSPVEEPQDSTDKKPSQESEINKIASTPSITVGDDTKETEAVSGEIFVEWLKSGIIGNTLTINNSNAKLHIVKGKLFLVTPGIFQLFFNSKGITNFTKKDIENLQYSFQDLKLHKKYRQSNNDSINFWRCKVIGPRKTSQLIGYLIDKTDYFFGNRIPIDNLHLSLIEENESE